MEGGYPFTNQVDTLTFRYKYTPSGLDTAQVHMVFKNSGSPIAHHGIQITGFTSSYQYIKIPFDLAQIPDTVAIEVQSSAWGDSALSYVGSTLIIDDIRFKSEFTAGVNEANIAAFGMFPNPADDYITISEITESGKLTILDLSGRTLVSRKVVNDEVVSVSALSLGMYVVKLEIDGVVSEQMN